MHKTGPKQLQKCKVADNHAHYFSHINIEHPTTHADVNDTSASNIKDNMVGYITWIKTPSIQADICTTLIKP